MVEVENRICQNLAATWEFAGDRRGGAILARDLVLHRRRDAAINQHLIDHSDKRAEVESEIPLRRLGQAEDIAATISWLASSEADYVTDSTLLVNDGTTLFPRLV